MTFATPAPAPVLDEPAPRKAAPVRFRRASVPPPDRAMVHRQMSAAALAFQVFGDADGARAFLNAAHDALDGGRPVDVAGASDAGFEAVTRLIEQARAPGAA